MSATQTQSQFEELTKSQALQFWVKHGCIKIYSRKLDRVIGLARDEIIAEKIREKGYAAFTIDNLDALRALKTEDLKSLVDGMEIFNGKLQNERRTT